MAQQVKKTTNSSSKENTNVKIEKENKVEIDNSKDIEIERLKKENEEKENKLNSMSNDLDTLKAQLELLLKQNALNNNSVNKSNETTHEDVEVGFRGIYAGALATDDGNLVYRFNYNETKFIDYDDMKTLLKEGVSKNNRILFENDNFFFVDEKYYKEFKIKKRVDLSPENVIRIITCPDANEMIGMVNKLTNNLVDFNILHNFQFEVVKLLINDQEKLKNWKYENRVTLEKYIGQKFDDLMAAVGAVELLGRTKYKI